MPMISFIVQRKLDRRHFKGSSAPAAPDPVATANAQADANIKAAQQGTAMSRYDQVTPFGSTKWSQDGDKWTSTFQLDPAIEKMLGQYQGAANTPLQTVGTEGLPGVASGGDYMAIANNGLSSDQYGLNQAMGIRSNVADVVGKQMGQLSATYDKPFDYSGAPAMPTADEATRKNVEDAYYQRQTSRLDPQYRQMEAEMRTRLANQGLTEGSEAYNRELELLGRTRNDAYSTARNDATTNSTSELAKLFGMGLSARQQGVGEANYLRDQPLKEAQGLQGLYSGYNADVNAGLGTQMAQQQNRTNTASQMAGLDSSLRGNALNERLTLNNQQQQQRSQLLNELIGLTSGSQIQGGGAGQVDVAAAPIAQSIYNTYQGQLQAQANANAGKSGLLSGIGALGSAGAALYTASDPLVKTNVVRVGTHPMGIGLYEFEYKPEFQELCGYGRFRGVMADEVEAVMPAAVARHADGFRMVNYSMLEG